MKTRNGDLRDREWREEAEQQVSKQAAGPPPPVSRVGYIMTVCPSKVGQLRQARIQVKAVGAATWMPTTTDVGGLGRNYRKRQTRSGARNQLVT